MEEFGRVLDEIQEAVDLKEEHGKLRGCGCCKEEEEDDRGSGEDVEEHDGGEEEEVKEDGGGGSDDDVEGEAYGGGGDDDEGEAYGGGDDDEEECSGGDDEEYSDTQEEGDTEEWDEDEVYDELDGRWMPYKYNLPRPFCNQGLKYTLEAAERIFELTSIRNCELIEEWCEMSNNNVTPLPTGPLVVLPEVTPNCVTGDDCYHRRYWTDILSPTMPAHPYFRPCGMMQLFSLGLSTTPSRPINVYGHFAVRDCWEPLRNHLFQRSRDDPVTILPGCSLLPLSCPSRGIFVLQYILVDIALWIKGEGDESTDKPLFHGCIELNASLSGFNRKLEGRIHGNCYSLDMFFAFISGSIESFVEVFAEAKNTSEMKISAFTSGCDEEIALFDGIFNGTGTLARHFLAVKLLGELHIVLKVNGSLYSWTFQAGVGARNEPKHPMSEFVQFVVRVSFRTKGKAASTWQWSSICDDVQLVEI